VLVENLTADPRFAEIWSISLTAEHLIVELLGHLPVFLPPCTDRVHIVGRGGADREVRIPCRVREVVVHGLRHALDLKRKNPQTVHDARHTCRNHSQVLTAGEHACGIKECRKFLHCGVIPEVVVTIVEEVCVETVKGSATVCVEPLV